MALYLSRRGSPQQAAIRIKPMGNLQDASQANGPTRAMLVAVRGPRGRRHLWRIIKASAVGFLLTFGLLGPLLLGIIVICIVWTSFLIVLTLRPNETANFIMDTGRFDDGEFWQIVESGSNVRGTAITALIEVNLYFTFVLVKMLRRRRKCDSAANNRAAKLRQWITLCARKMPIRASQVARVAKFWTELTSLSGKYRKYWNVILKIVDLSMQSMQLRQGLEAGFPTSLVRGYTIFIAMNSVSVALGILLRRHSAMTEIMVDTMFDLVAAIGYPIWILVYSYVNFDFDRQGFQINVSTFPPGTFETVARIYASPSEIAFFRTCFDSLRFLTLGNLVMRVGLNLTLCHRFSSIVDFIVQSPVLRKRSIWPVMNVPSASRTDMKIQQAPVQHPVPKIIALVFIAFSAGLMVCVEASIVASATACRAYSQCAVYAYRWNERSASCPCLVLIDLDRTPRTLEEWYNPVDLTSVVKALAASGDLQVIHIINRALPRWPEELRRCRGLQYMLLLYTGIESLPSWAKEFRALQVIQLEGKELFYNLKSLPSDLFSDMPELTYLHVGVHENLRKLPALSGVPRMRSLTVARMFALEELPELDKVPNLRRLNIVHLPRVQVLPDLSNLKHLVHVASYRRSAYCCDGFLGTCNPQSPMCIANPTIGIPAFHCIDSRATAGTLAVVSAFAQTFCIETPLDAVNATDALTPAAIEACGGVPFRQCEYPPGSGLIGICYNNRLQVLSCITDPDAIRLRRAYIAAGLNPACNPAEEAWLGCRQS